MKKILFILILATSLLHSQNEKTIKKTFSEYNTKTIDQISLDNKLKKGDLVILNAKLTINSIGEITNINTEDTTELFQNEIISIINNIPKLSKNSENNDVIYSVNILLKLDSFKKRKKRISNNKNIKFKEIKISKYYVLNKSEIFSIKDLDNSPVFHTCNSLTNENMIKKCLEKDLLKHIAYNFNSRVKGYVNISFIISKSGEIINIKPESKNKTIENEAYRVISLLPNFIKPGKIKGKPVYVKYETPLRFNYSN